MPLRPHRDALEKVYANYARREFVAPDPLEVVWEYDDPADREVAAFVAAGLAYGRAKQALRSARNVLARMERPAAFLRDHSAAQVRRAMTGFVHRFTTGDDMANALIGLAKTTRRHGSLHRAFAAGLSRGDETVLPAATAFAAQLRHAAGGRANYLIVSPADGSACKRLNLMLRWLVRSADVDPGGWGGIGSERLIVPLDVHMHRICTTLGATRRRGPDLRAALEITAAFRGVAPDDPVRYDFPLTRLGIHPDLEYGKLLNSSSP